MIRRLNFTGRKKLSRTDARLRLEATPEGRLEVKASLSLGAYGLPPSARVFVEATRQTSWQRFDFGTAASPAAAAPALLRGFGGSQGIRFRVVVVDAEPPPGGAPRLLALVDGLRPAVPAARGAGLSLLPVDWSDELVSHTWRLEIDEASGPLLLVSRALVPDRDAFIGSREFVSLVIPSVLREVLGRAILVVERDEDEGWASDWLRLVRAWPGVSTLPRRPADAAGLSDDEESWLEEVVESFARRHQIGERFSAWWNAEPA